MTLWIMVMPHEKNTVDNKSIMIVVKINLMLKKKTVKSYPEIWIAITVVFNLKSNLNHFEVW